MRKPRHENPHAERLIASGQLRRYFSARELAELAETEEKEDADRAARAARGLELAALKAELRQLERRCTRATVKGLSARTLATGGRWRMLAAELDQRRRVVRARVWALDVVPWSELSPAELAFRWMLDRCGHEQWVRPREWRAHAQRVIERWRVEHGLPAQPPKSD